MNIELLKEWLLWCALINYAVLLAWFLVLMSVRGRMFALHARWFKIDPGTFDLVHYAAMAVYKIGIILFNLAPLGALWLIDRS